MEKSRDKGKWSCQEIYVCSIYLAMGTFLWLWSNKRYIRHALLLLLYPEDNAVHGTFIQRAFWTVIFQLIILTHKSKFLVWILWKLYICYWFLFDTKSQNMVYWQWWNHHPGFSFGFSRPLIVCFVWKRRELHSSY